MSTSAGTTTQTRALHPLTVRWLGRVGYGEGQRLQRRLVRRRRALAVPDTLLLLEHDPVITLGRSAHAHHVRIEPDQARARGIEVHHAGRGGDVTFHGPGQLVGYPVLALGGDRRDAHRYLRDLEEVLIRVAAVHGVSAGRCPGLTGIWVGTEKLGAIGVRISTGWVTSHGFALNVGADLSGFDTVVPCGIRDRGVTSLTRLTGRELLPKDVASCVGDQFAAVFDLERLP